MSTRIVIVGAAGVIYLRGMPRAMLRPLKTKKYKKNKNKKKSFSLHFLKCFQIKYRQLRPDWGAKRHALIAFDCIFICMARRGVFFVLFSVLLHVVWFSFCTLLSCSYFYAFCQHFVVGLVCFLSWTVRFGPLVLMKCFDYFLSHSFQGSFVTFSHGTCAKELV